jgi:hypothetical protein
MTKRRLLLWIAAPVLVVGLIVLFGARVKRGVSDTAAQPVSASAHGPLLYPPVPPPPTSFPSDEARGNEGASARTPAPAASGPLNRDSKEYAKEIADKAEFQAFASSASLTPDEQVQVSHIVALYMMDDESLRSSITDAEKLASMRKQLLIHMHIRVRAKIPTKWEAFERTTLLPSPTDFEKSPT